MEAKATSGFLYKTFYSALYHYFCREFFYLLTLGGTLPPCPLIAATAGGNVFIFQIIILNMTSSSLLALPFSAIHIQSCDNWGHVPPCFPRSLHPCPTGTRGGPGEGKGLQPPPPPKHASPPSEGE